MSPQPPTIPSHLSEEWFRFFEPHISVAVNNWPDDTRFDFDALPNEAPKRYSPSTLVGRFRDAIVSLKRFGWETSIDLEKLWGMSGKYVIWLEPGTRNVWLRAKRRAGKPTGLVGEARQRGVLGESDGDLGRVDPLEGVIPWKDATAEEVEAISLLLNNKRVEGPILLSEDVSKTMPATVEVVSSHFDVSFTWDEKRGVTVIL